MKLIVPLILSLSFPAFGLQEGKGKAPEPNPGKVDQAGVDAAIGRGVDFLKSRMEEILRRRDRPGGGMGAPQVQPFHELVLWTYLHAGVPESDAEFRSLLTKMLEGELETTYRVSLQAMILEELDRVKYQPRLAQCAQFLVDNQCRNGQWSYGEPTTYDASTPTAGRGAREDVASQDRAKVIEFKTPAKPIEKPKVKRKITVKKQREGPAFGDNSNAQYACLGLRACHEAGIVLPKEVVVAAQKWWRESQYDEDPAGGGYSGAGWGYLGKNRGVAYGSMTAGAVGSLAICDHILGEKWKADPAVRRGVEWLTRNFSVTDNPGHPGGGRWNLYYLYALERAGILCSTESFGKREWYSEGAKVILESQKGNGSWETLPDTCFAILFLRRATRRLDVASVDRFAPSKSDK